MLMQRIRDFVEQGLGNLAISVSMLKQVLKGQDTQRVRDRLQQFEQDTLGSLQGGEDGRSLRGLQGTVSVLIQRAQEACLGDAALWDASRSLLGILSVLDPAGVPRRLFDVDEDATVDSTEDAVTVEPTQDAVTVDSTKDAAGSENATVDSTEDAVTVDAANDAVPVDATIDSTEDAVTVDSTKDATRAEDAVTVDAVKDSARAEDAVTVDSTKDAITVDAAKDAARDEDATVDSTEDDGAN